MPISSMINGSGLRYRARCLRVPVRECYHRGCLLAASNDFIECLRDAAGGVWRDAGKCLLGCLPSLYFGSEAYGACLAVSTDLGSWMEINACLTEYQSRKKGCEVDDRFCK